MHTTAERAKQIFVSTSLAVELASGELDLPVIPSVAQEVIGLAQSKDTNAQDLAEKIQQDPMFVAHLIRVVNSAAFRGFEQIDDLHHAIARLGLAKTREVALGIAMGSVFVGGGPYAYLVTRGWQHALRTALWAKEVARKLSQAHEVAYMCGLLHNVGMPAIANRVFELNAELSEFGVLELIKRFESQAGLKIAERWQLPQMVRLVIEHYQDYEHAPQSKDLAATINAAALLGQAQASDALDPELVSLFPSVSYLQLDEHMMAELIHHEARISKEVASIA